MNDELNWIFLRLYAIVFIMPSALMMRLLSKLGVPTSSTVLIVSNLIKFAVPMSLFVWSLFQPTIASYVFVGLAAIFVGHLFFIDIASRPKPDPLIWTPDEMEVIRDYHLALRFPFGARDFSCYLNGIRWSSLIWMPWLLWNHLWIPAAFLAINFFVSAALSVRLDPFFLLADAVRRGHMRFAAELATLRAVQEKLNERANSQQPAPGE